MSRVQRRAQELAERHRARRQEAAVCWFSSQPGAESAGSADRSASAESRASATPVRNPVSSADQESDTPGAVPSGTPSAVTPGAVPSGTPSSAMTRACSICQDDFATGEHVAWLECGHVFNLQCLGIWVATQTSQRQVPVCPHYRLPGDTEPRDEFVPLRRRSLIRPRLTLAMVQLHI